jgi:hypothetical protein
LKQEVHVIGRRLSLFLLLVVITSALQALPIDRHVRVPLLELPLDSKCGGDISAPIDIVIDAISPLRQPGGVVQVFGTITPRKDIDGLEVRFEAAGSASIFQREPWHVGRVTAGVPIEFSLLARFGLQGGAVHVWADTEFQQEAFRWSKRESLYGIVHRDRLYTGMGDEHRLRTMAIRDDLAAGILNAAEAKAAEEALAIVPAIRHSRPVVFREFTEEEQRLNEIVGARPARHRDGIAADSHHPSNMILVQGNVSWTDENGNTHPVFGASVSIRDEDTFGDETIVVVGTDVNGNYEAIVDNNDGFGAGNRDIYVVVRAENTLVSTKTTGGTVYTMTSPVHDEVPDGTTITENFIAPNFGNGSAWSVFQSATWIAVYARSRNGGSIPSVDVIWPNGSTGSFYNGDVQIEQADRWDWDTIHHEYGHFVMDLLNIEDNPGGPHNISDCHAIVRGSKGEGLRLAWGEGWPTFFGTAGQLVMNMAALNVPRVGDTLYEDLEDGSLSYDLEAQTSGGRGEDNELAVQRLLWDLFDNNNDGRDTISRSDQSMWNAVNAADPTTLSGGWAALRAGQSTAVLLQMGAIATDHGIGPRLVAPVAGTVVTPSNAVFNWTAAVGCDPSFGGNSFDLRFYDATTLAPILTIANLNGISTALTDAQIGQLTAVNHQVIWAVEARNTSSPSTGPYLGESFQITVNRPPIADAGPDQTVECTSSGTTAVALNGTGSSDPDGDALTYHWSAPGGVTFNNPNSPTPIGQFPIGTRVVTLTVSDGISQRSDTVSITVQDTTPPVISCPIDIVVECTGDLGIDASDPQLAPFFGGVSAVDTCDASPSITSDAPAFFPLGTTLVTFTATDAHGNSSSCSRNVTVVDTKAPEITVTLTPTVLWPPTHKMFLVDATVTVTDECDPNPTFVLTSITSNEPDNGLGDGDHPNDIQAADFGTPDTSFLLRAERSGLGSGRIYTIIYTASDSSGNTASASATVQVPHQR